MGDKRDPEVLDEAFFRDTIELAVRTRCHGSCKFCKSSYGGPTARFDGWEGLASRIFGYCSNRCRLAAGEPQPFDIQAAMKILFPNAN